MGNIDKEEELVDFDCLMIGCRRIIIENSVISSLLVVSGFFLMKYSLGAVFPSLLACGLIGVSILFAYRAFLDLPVYYTMRKIKNSELEDDQ